MYPEKIKKVLDVLEENGYEAYIVGGSLRNILMGKEPSDWDVTTSAFPDETLELFRSKGFKVIETGLKHGTVTVLCEGEPIEITTFRIDGDYSDARHPDKVTFTRDLKTDLERRDFTVNAMAYNEKTGLVDLFGGKEDLERGMIRCVGEPKKRFTEDALRIFRAFRFSSEHGFSIEENTLRAIRDCRGGLRSLSRERIFTELRRTLMGDFASEALKLLCECGLMPFIFEEYDESSSPPCSLFDKLPKNEALRFACFFSGFEKGKVREAVNSLKPANALKNDVLSILDAVSYIGENKNSFEDELICRRFISKYAELAHSSSLLAGLLGKCGRDVSSHLENAEKKAFPRRISDLCISGADVLALGASGRVVGDILEFLLEETMKHPEKNEKSHLSELAKARLSGRTEDI